MWVRFIISTSAVLALGACSLESSIKDLIVPEALPAITVSDLILVEGASGNIVLSLDKVSTENIIVAYISNQSTATAGSDYTSLTGSATILAGQTTATIPVTTADDSWCEGTEDFTMSYTAPTNAVVVPASVTKTVQITDTEARPTVEYANATESVAENVGGGVKAISVSLTGACQRPVTVNYSLGTGSTATTADYSVTWGTLTIPSNTTSGTFNLNVTNDIISEPSENLVMRISSPSSQVDLGAVVSETLTITDDEGTPTLSFAAGSSTVAENVSGGNHTVVVNLSNPSASQVTVGYSAAGGTATGSGTDYNLGAGTLTFAAGSTTQTITMAINNDTISEANETFDITLATPTNATITGTNPHVATINDNDGLPTITFAAATQNSNENGGAQNIVIQLSNASSTAITVDYDVADGTATGGGTDFTLADGSLNFTAGQTTKTISVTFNDDATYEPTENFSITLQNPSVNATVGVPGIQTHNIIDNETQPTVQFAASTSNGSEATTPHTVNVTLSAASSAQSTVNYSVTSGTATGSGTDYTLAAGVLTFVASDTSEDISIVINNDALAEGAETIVITLATPSGVTLGTTTVHTHTINDDESVPTIEFAASASSSNENVGSHTIPVNMGVATATTVKVDYAINVASTATGGGTDYTLVAGTLTFLAGDMVKNIVIPVNDDAIGEPAETIVLDLSNVVGTASLGTTVQHTYTINASDVPTIQYAAATSTVVENVGGLTKDVVVNLSNAASASVTVVYQVTTATPGTATGTGTDYTLASATLTYTAGQTTKTFTVGITNDNIYEGDETINLEINTPSANASLGSQVSHVLTITDDDTAPTVQFAAATSSGGEATTPHTWAVTLSRPASAQVTVDYTVLGTGTAAGGGTDYTLASDTLTFAAGSTTQNISAVIVNDTVYEGDETINLTISNPTVATLGGQTTHTHTITDNETMPTVQFAAATSNDSEANTPYTVNVTLSAAVQAATTVTYSVTGTATGSGTDYTLAAGTVSFASLDASEDISIAIVNDALAETNETIIITLATPSGVSLGTTTVHTHTITDDDAAAFTWTGATHDGKWSTAGNWSTSAVPGSGNTAIFNGACAGTDCNVAIDASVDVAGIDMQSTYTGTITQGAYNVTVGSSNWILAAGTFVGSTNAIAVNGSYTQSGGTFTAGAQAIGVTGDWVRSAGTMTMTGSTASFTGTGTSVINVASAAFANLTLAKATAVTVTGIANVSGTLTLNSATMTVNTGTLGAAGDITVTAAAGGNAIVNINGTGAQALAGASGASLPSVTINKSNTLTLSGTIDVGGNWTYTAGTVAAATSHVRLVGGTAATINDATTQFYKLTYRKTANLTLASHLTVTNDFAKVAVTGASSNAVVGSFTINVGGNVSYSTPGGSYSANSAPTLNLNGTSGTQTVTSVSSAPFEKMIINSASTVVFSGNVYFAYGVVYSGATAVTFTGSTLYFRSGPSTINLGALVTNNIDISLFNAALTTTGTLHVGGNANLGCASGSCAYAGGTIDAQGNLTLNSVNVTGGTAAISFTGTGTQTLTQTAGTWPTGTVTVNKASGKVLQAGNVAFGAAQDIIFAQAGTWDMAGFSLTLDDFDGSSGTGSVYKKCGTLTYDQIVPTVNIYNATMGTTFSIADASAVTEGTASSFVITLNQNNCATTTFTYSSANGTAVAGEDFTVATNTAVTIPVNTTSYTVSFATTDDTIDESNGEDYTLTVSNLVGVTGADTVATGTINDNDAAPVINFAAATSTAAEAVGTQNILVNLSNASSAAIVFTVVPTGTATGSGTDYTLASTSVTVAAGATVATIPVVVIDDAASEASETVILTLGTVTGGTATIGTTIAAHTFTITDNDALPFTWIGASGVDQKWSRAANWSTGVVPTSSDTAIFTSACAGANCNVTVDAYTAVGGVDMQSGYTGTIDVTGNLVDATSFSLAGGTWANGTIQVSGSYVQSGGALAGNLNVRQNATRTGGTIGNITLFLSGSTSSTIDLGVITVGSLHINKSAAVSVTVVGTLKVNGNVQVASSAAATVDGGTIELMGVFSDLFADPGALMGGGTGTFLFTSANDQAIAGRAGVVVPNVTINKSAQNLYLNGTVEVAGNFTRTAGAINAGTNTLRFVGSTAATFTTGGANYYNVQFLKSNTGVDYQGALNVLGDLTVNQTGASSYLTSTTSSTLTLTGNATFTANAATFTTSPSGQTYMALTTGNHTITGSAGGLIPDLNVNSNSTNVTLSGTLDFDKGLILTDVGTLTATGSTVRIAGSAFGTLTIEASQSLNNVTVTSSGASSTLGSTVAVAGDLTFASTGSGSINGNAFDVKGNVSMSALSGGTSGITLSGTGTQTITASGGTWPSGTVTVNKSAGMVRSSSALSFNTAGQDVVFAQAGPWDMAGFNLVVNDKIDGSAGTGTIYKNCAITLSGTIVPTVNVIDGTYGVSISVADAGNVTEGTAQSWVITQTPANCVATTFDYATSDGTAVQPGDYTASGTASTSITAGATTKTITVTTVNDSVYEVTEYYTLTLSNLLAGVTAGTIVDAGNILDNDTQPTIDIANLSIPPGSPAIFVVTLTSASGANVTFNYATSDGTATAGSDYTAVSSTSATITAGSTVLTLPNVTTSGTATPGEYFNLNLSSIVGATAGTVTGTTTFSAPVPIYRSVGPSNTTVLAGGGSNAFTVSGSTATFTNALPDNIGVGDAVIYNSGVNIAFIHARSTNKVFTIKSAAGAAPVAATADTSWTIYRAYTSLAKAVAGDSSTNGNSNIPSGIRNFDTWSTGRDMATNNEQWNIALYADAADVANVAVTGWTTSATQYLKIYTPYLSTEVGVTQRHNGSWNGSGYLLSVTTNKPLQIHSSHVRVDGLRIQSNSPANSNNMLTVANISATGQFYFSNNILRGSGAGWGSWMDMISINTGSALGSTYFYNNIIFTDSTMAGNSGVDCFYVTDGTVYIYNNVCVNLAASGSGLGNGIENGGGTVFAKNNLTQFTSDPGYQGTFASGSNYNLSSDGSSTGGANDQVNTSVIFLDSANNDFRLSNADSAAKDLGTNLSADANLPFSTDATGTTRTGSWDIGATEASGPMPIYRSVGAGSTAALATGASNNLTIGTDGIATFTTAPGDNIGVGDALIYATSGSTIDAIAFIYRRLTSTKYLIRSKTGAIPTARAAFSTWSLYRAYTSLANANSQTENTGIAAGGPSLSAADKNFDQSTDLVTGNLQFNIALYADAVDGTTDISVGWATSATQYLNIYTPVSSSEVGSSQRHRGYFGAGYQIYFSGSSQPGFMVFSKFIRFDGLQIASRNTNAVIFTYPNSGANDLRFSNNIININSDIASDTAIKLADGGSTSTFYLYNNVIYDLGNHAYDDRNAIIVYAGTAYVYNNTLYNFDHGLNNASGNAIAKNNIAITNGTSSSYNGTFTSSSYNLANDSSTAGTNSITTKYVHFNNPAAGDFRLTGADLYAKDAGTNLSADSVLPFSTDATGATRTGTWDIGATEASSVIPIYRSVGPTNTTAVTCGVTVGSCSGTGNNVGFANNVITFDTAIVSRVGVGDAIVWDSNSSNSVNSGDTVAYIYNRISNKKFQVRTVSGGSTGSTYYGSRWAIFRAYTSLSNAESGKTGGMNSGLTGAGVLNSTANASLDQWTNGRDLVANSEQWNIALYADAAESSSLFVDGWTTSAANYLKIYASSTLSEVGISQRHNGFWDDTKARVVYADGYNAFRFDADVWIDGLQVRNVMATNTYTYGIGLDTTTAVTTRVSNNIVDFTGSTGGDNITGIQLGGSSSVAGSTNYAWNNIIQNCGLPDSVGIKVLKNGTNYVYNNTIYGFNGTGGAGYQIDPFAGTATFIAKNNIAQNVSVGYQENNGGVFSTLSSNNLSSDATSPGSNPQNSKTVTFIGSDDYRLSSSDTLAKDLGLYLGSDPVLAVTTDIAGASRAGIFDIGASESVAVGTDIFVRGLSFSSITSSGFVATLAFNGDSNTNAAATMYYCNQTDTPTCDPLAGTSVAMTMSGLTFTYTVSGLAAPNDSGDKLRVVVVVTDANGVTASSSGAVVTLL